MSSFYKMDPSAWDFGTSGLSLEEEAAYLRIVNAIHKHDHPVPNNDRILAGMFRCSTRKARALLNALIEAGKVRIEDGHITNDRAISELVRRGFVSSSRAESGAKGGRTRAERAAKSLERKEQQQAIASSRIEENREDIPIANAIGGDAPKPPPAADDLPEPDDDFAKQLFDRAVAFLGRHGTDDRQARSLVGKWRKNHGDAEIFEAFSACHKAGVVDPVPWLVARFKPKPEQGQPAINDNVIRMVNESLGIAEARRIS